jgi:hypothetical protein
LGWQRDFQARAWCCAAGAWRRDRHQVNFPQGRNDRAASGWGFVGWLLGLLLPHGVSSRVSAPRGRHRRRRRPDRMLAAPPSVRRAACGAHGQCDSSHQTSSASPAQVCRFRGMPNGVGPTPTSTSRRKVRHPGREQMPRQTRATPAHSDIGFVEQNERFVRIICCQLDRQIRILLLLFKDNASDAGNRIDSGSLSVNGPTSSTGLNVIM